MNDPNRPTDDNSHLSNNFNVEPRNPLFPSAYPSQGSSSKDLFDYFKGYFEKPRDRKGDQEKVQKDGYSRKDERRERSRSPLQSTSSFHGHDGTHPKESRSKSPAKEESISRKGSADRKLYSKSPEVDSFSNSKQEKKAEKVRGKSSERKKERRKELSLFSFSEDESHTFNPYYDKPGSSGSGSSSKLDLIRRETPDRFQQSPLKSGIVDPFKSTSCEREIQRVEPPLSTIRPEPKRSRSRSFSLEELDDLDLPDIISTPAQLSDVSSEKSDYDFGLDQLRGSGRTRENSQGKSRSSYNSEFDNPPRQPKASEQTSRRETFEDDGWQERAKNPQYSRPGFPSSASSREPSRRDSDKRDIGCIQCFSNAHILENCKHFLKMSIEDRKELIRHFPGKICLGCLQKDHLLETCTQKNQCSTTSPACGNPLHPLLHHCLEPNCFVCQNGKHSVQDCEVFVEMPMQARWDIVRSQKVCSICLKMNHSYSTCSRLAGCPKSKICSITHHPLLHVCETTGHRKDEDYTHRHMESRNFEPNSRRSHSIENWDDHRMDHYQSDRPSERHSRESSRDHRNEHLDDSSLSSYWKGQHDHRDFKFDPRYDASSKYDDKDVRTYKERYNRSGSESSSRRGFDRQLYHENSRYGGPDSRDNSNPDAHGRSQPGGNKYNYYHNEERQQVPVNPQPSSFGHHQRGLPEVKEDDKYYKQSNYEYINQSRSSKFDVEDVYRSRSQSKESCHTEVYCNRCKSTGHQPNSCPTLSAAKDDSKKLNMGLENLYSHFYYSMKKSGKDTRFAWDMTESWRATGHSEQSLRGLVERHQPKTRQLLETLLLSELRHIPRDLEVNPNHVVDETIRFLENESPR